ncbi:MAG: sensor domain-containing diguanylate cyclase [Prochlorotrichaceae cyanobacterium]
MLFTFERNFGQYLLKLLQYCPLRIILVVPFLLEITSIVGLVGYLSDRSGNESVSYLVEQLMNQTAERIEINLKDFLQTPQAVLTTNRLSLEGGLVNPQNQAAMERLFWQNIFTFDSLTDLTFASADDGYVAVGRDQQGLISPVDSIITVHREEGKRLYYLTDDQGKPQRIVHTQSDWDTHARDWYKQGIQQPPGSLHWTPVYAFQGLPQASIRLVSPLYEGQKVIGAMGAGLFLSDISLFLSELDFSPQGQVFLMERSGDLVATSTQEKTFVKNIAGHTLVRLAATQSRDWLTRTTAQIVMDTQNLTLTYPGTFRAKGSDRLAQRYFFKVYSFQDAYGIDWLLVLTVPEQDFMGAIFQNRQRTVLLCGLALVGSMGLGILTANWIARPILTLKAATNAIDRDQFDLTLPPTIILEIQHLNQGFEKMAKRLKTAFDLLAKNESELIEKVKERTQDLEKANTQLLRLSRTDALTKVANRGEFNRVLNHEINRLKRSQQRIALLMLDVDFFKRYNDRYGHLQGDYCLIQVAQALKQVVKRSTDLLARYGGEEFVIILPESDLAGAIVVAEQIQQTVRQLKIPHEDSDVNAVVTVSMGISVIKLCPSPLVVETWSEILIKQADAALYQAKTQGRDRYAIFS